MRVLTEGEKNLWERMTANVRPLQDRPAVTPQTPTQGPSVSPAFTPRAEDFTPVLDLHGKVLHDAYQASKSHIVDAYHDGYRYVIIITGLSGQIHEEFPRWLSEHHLVRSINKLRGGGAWEVWLKRRNSS